MKNRYNQVPTRFRRETRFDVPIPAVPFRGSQEADLELLKNRLLADLLWQTDSNAELSANLRHAATEAAGLAWFTPYPLLFFPALLEEKAQAARDQVSRQAEILCNTQDLLEKAST